MLKNYAGTFVVALITGLSTLFVLCPFVVEPDVGGIRGGVLTPHEWMVKFSGWCFWAIVVCLLSVFAWIYLSAERYPIDFSGKNTQMPYWILHAIPPLLVAIAGFMLLPSISEGWSDALMTITIPVLLQFWISSLLFSRNRSSIPGGGWLH